MKSNSFKYLVGEGAKNVWYNRLMSFASVGVLTTCLLLVGFAMLFTMNVDEMVEFVMQQNEAVVFLKDEANDEQVAKLRQDLENNGNIDNITFISKEQAFEDQRETLGDDSLMEGLDKDTFPASFRVRIVDLSKMNQTVAALEKMDNVQKVNASPELAGTLSSAKNMVNIFGAVVIGALIIVSIVIIANTIRASVFSRRREINIMKYVGATDGFIRLPFVVEGLLLGFLSALVAFFVIWGAYTGLTHLITGGSSLWLKTMFQSIIPFKEVAWQIGLAFAGAGMITGGIGSAFCISSHLKV